MESTPGPRHASAITRGFRLAWMLTLAYTLLIVYASLQPFRDWRFPPQEILHFLFAPWPRYITLEDVLINLAAYAPLGLLLALALRARLAAAPATALATVAGALLSLAMESAQMFLPTRIASNLDLLTNGTGTLLGALAALPLFSPGLPGSGFAAVRRRLFAEGTMTDTGLVIAGLWLLTSLHPTAQPFGTGNLRGTFDLPVYFFHTPQLFLSTEAAIVLFNLLGLGLTLAALTREARQPFGAIAVLVASGLAIKAAAAMLLLKSPGPLAWLTPGVALGLAAGAVLLYPLVRLPRRAKMITAALCFGAAVATINLAPDNPYQTVPPQLLSGSPSHFLSMSGIVRALSELWPFLAIAYLIAASGAARPQA